MDVFKLLETIEEFIYRAALWVLLVPRTLLVVVMRPTGIVPYVTGELAKTADERFKDQLSPILLWVLAALVPHIMLIDLLSTIPDSRVAKELEWQNLMAAPWATRLAVIAVVALAGPLAFAWRTLRDLNVKLDRDTLRAPFFVQCYCFTPAYMALLPIVYYALRYDALPDGKPTVLVAWIACGAWLATSQTFVLSQQLAISRFAACVRACGYLVSAVVLLVVLELFVITIYHGFAVWG